MVPPSIEACPCKSSNVLRSGWTVKVGPLRARDPVPRAAASARPGQRHSDKGGRYFGGVAKSAGSPTIEEIDEWRHGYPPTPGCFLELLILKDFKSFAPEVLVLKGLKCDFSELLIPHGLWARKGPTAALASSDLSGAGMRLQLTQDLSTLFPCMSMIMLRLFE